MKGKILEMFFFSHGKSEWQKDFLKISVIYSKLIFLIEGVIYIYIFVDAVIIS